ncbi:MAG: DNA-processing protein DprA [Thermoguttaceae bacterium]|nr:DNA-processing protein DprA [Thermoguttaceae bacterium]MDW8078305.1 DNA-processing protein DprA [Thermoguttaceae bacterium]
MARESRKVSDLDQLLLGFEGHEAQPEGQPPGQKEDSDDALTGQGAAGPEEAVPKSGASSARALPSHSAIPAGEDVESRIAYLRLALVEGVGPRTIQFLLARFGTPEAVLRASPTALQRVPRIGPVLAERITQAPSETEVRELLALCRQENIAILFPDSPDYPELLRQLPDPPTVLFVKGELLPQDYFAVAIVGTRHATPYGLRQAERLAAGLAAVGFTIVSGLARGIDAAAHRGALLAGGRTLAVLGSGILNVYPPEHKDLAHQIVSQGALLSECRPFDPPVGNRFPKRNRIISGLSWGTIVVEAGAKSGALITAQHALNQGREVFAVPGRADDRTAQGCNRLLRDGATMVTCPEDVIEVLRPMIASGRDHFPAKRGKYPTVAGANVGFPVSEPGAGGTCEASSVLAGSARPSSGVPAGLGANLSEKELAVLRAVGEDPTSIDWIVASTGLPTAEVLATISLLEMRQLLRRLGGNWVCRR